jgi:gamma-glutamylcyclotransferase (GGCT)/AIG2-like uncharacterized protein YtfP
MRTRSLVALLVPGLLAAFSSTSAGAQCNAAPDLGRPQYIVGYGSLMQDESRARTSPRAGPAHPVELRGYRRGWYARSEAFSLGTTYLGVVEDRESGLNAVIYEVDVAELGATDRREAVYCRVGVALMELKLLELDFVPAPNAQAWIYVSKPENVATPSARYPIVQSYVDIFVSGCLEQEQRLGRAGFSEQCLSTTADWSEHWVNDRIYPRRPFAHQPRARQIDELLARRLGRFFARIRIEPGG